MRFTFTDVGTKYVTLTVVDALHRRATRKHNVVVTSAPGHTAAPVISGTPRQNQVLNTTNGSWVNRPTSYAHAWLDCDRTGRNCAAIAGATSTAYILKASDVRHTIRSTVTATNRSGSRRAMSAATGVTSGLAPGSPADTAPPTISGAPAQGSTMTASRGSWSGSTPMSYTYQWQDDGAENISGATSSTYTSRASDVGHALDVVVTASNPYGSAQAKSAAVGPVTTPSQNKNCAGTPGSGTPSTANLDACGYPSPDNTGVPSGIALTPVSGDMTITTPGTVVNAMAFTGGTIHVDANNVTIENSSFALSTPSGQAIFVSAGVSGTVVKYCTFHGMDNQSGSLFIGVFNDGGDQLTLDHDQAYWTDDILHGSGTLTNSYSVDDANIPNDHYEPIYYGGGGGSLIVNHDTLLNPHSWTAAVFTKNDFGDIGTVAIANSLLAGGGYTLYGGLSGNNGNVNGPITVVNNRFSRLYYPDSGYWGVDAYFNPAITSWSGNIWDDTLATVGP